MNAIDSPHPVPVPFDITARASGGSDASGTIISAPDDLVDWGIFGLQSSDPRARPFILLRSQILSAAEKMHARVLAVTSPTMGNGKSYVAANLATALCRVADVCLVDMHLRRPVVGEWFETPAKTGTGGCLAGRQFLGESLYRVDGERLSIVPAGSYQEDPSTLLSMGMLEGFVSHLKTLNGTPLCILDCPPLLESDDMQVIARHVDAVILVAEEGKTTEREVSESLRMIQPTAILGTLVNQSIVPSSLSG